MVLKNLADQLIQLIAVFCFRIHAYKSGNSLAAAENEDGRDGRHAQAASDIASNIGIELGNYGLAFKFHGELFDDWGEHAARATPRGPEIDEHRLVALEDGTIPIRGIDFESTSGHFQFTLSQ